MRYILIILLSFISFLGYSQALPSGFPTQMNTGWQQWGYQQSTLGTIIATRDTAWTPRFCGTMVLWPNSGVDTAYWMWDCVRWKKLSSSGDIIAPVWGNITGTLSNQTDLQNALNLKFNTSDTANKWVQDIYVRSDSLFKFKNGAEIFLDSLSRNISNASQTANGDYSQNWNNKQLRIDSIASSLFFRGGGIGSTGTVRKEFSISWPGNSFANQFDQYSILSSIRKADNSADSLRLGLVSGGTGVLSMGHYDVASSANNTFISYSYLGLINISAKDSIWIKGATPAATADSILGVLPRSGGISRIVKIPIPVSSGATNNTNIGSAFRWLNEGTQEIKTVSSSNTIIWDSTSTANTLTAKVDTSVIATQYDLTQITPSSTLVSDLGPLSETKILTPSKGVASSQNVANYSHTSVDSARYMFSTTRAGTSGSEYGGWLAPSISGDSIRVTAPFWIVIGDSQAEGHPALHGRLDANGTGVYVWNYPDSIGQLSYHLRYLTNMRWYNHGIGGQTTTQVRARFYRDVLAETNPASIPTSTLTRRPQGVVIIVGINDVFNGIAAQTTKENLEWMAAVCQQYGIRCVILNMPGDEISGQIELNKIAALNNWLRGGVMDQYGACVVDYNSWWNDPAYGDDNVHPTALIVDDIHPSKVGYDSLANYIYREARLPVLTKALFINELDPGGFTGYSRPADITINSDAYTISAATELIDITTYVPDSVWIKVNSSTNVTGTTYSGFSHIEWFVDNNPNDSTYYTKRTLYSGSVTANQNISGLKLIDPINRTSGLGFPIFDVRLNDTAYRAFQLYTSGGSGIAILNGGTNTTQINNGILNVYGIIGSTSNVLANGSSHKFGDMQIMSNAKATTTGYGISAGNTIAGVDYQSTPAGGKPSHLFSYWNNATTTTLASVANSVTSIISVPLGFGNAGNTDQVGNVLSLTPTYNNTSAPNTGIEFRGIYYNPIITSLTNTRHVSIFQRSGNNYFNVAGTDSTCFGCDSASNILAAFRVNRSFRLDNVLEPPSTYNVLVHGLTDSIVYQVPISALGGTTLYTGDGTLAGSRDVNANNLNLTFSDVNTFRINYDMFVQAKADGTFPYTSVITGAAQNYQIAYTPTAGTYSKGSAVLIDTNNNVGLGTLPSSSAPLYTAGNSAYISGLQSQAGNYYRIDNVTADITIGLTHNFVTIDATGGNVTITLPAVSTAFGASMGIDYIFKRLDNSGNTVTIQRAGSDTIDGATSFTLTTQWEAKSLRALSTSAWGVY